MSVTKSTTWINVNAQVKQEMYYISLMCSD